MTELSLWNIDQAKQHCRVLGSVGVHLPFECYSQFVYVPYAHFSTKTEPMKRYLEKVGNIAVFLVQVDSSDISHVLIGFLNSGDRGRFLKTKDIIIPRTRKQASFTTIEPIFKKSLTI